MADVLDRLRRDTLIACAVMAGAALALFPDRPRLGLGVLGGGALIGLSAWAIRGAVDGLVARGDGRRVGPALVKSFTRHAILAVAAYVMMARLHLDPIGMLAGVSAIAAAAAAEAARVARGRPRR